MHKPIYFILVAAFRTIHQPKLIFPVWCENIMHYNIIHVFIDSVKKICSITVDTLCLHVYVLMTAWHVKYVNCYVPLYLLMVVSEEVCMMYEWVPQIQWLIYELYMCFVDNPFLPQCFIDNPFLSQCFIDNPFLPQCFIGNPFLPQCSIGNPFVQQCLRVSVLHCIVTVKVQK